MAHAVHALLYFVVIVMGASGIGLMVLSRAGSVLFFGAPGPLPHFSDFRPMAAHGAGAFATVGLLCFHVAGVIHHQFFRRDRLLARMGVGAVERGWR